MKNKNFDIAIISDGEVKNVKSFELTINGIQNAAKEIELWRIGGENCKIFIT